jgi:hypothetical protein
MASRIEVSLDNRKVSDTIRKMQGLQRRMRGEAEKTVATYGLLIETTAKELAPVDTGALRAATQFEIGEDKLSGKVANDLVYAPRIEFGFTGVDSAGRRFRQAAKPFMFPAFEQWRAPFFAALKANLQGALKK